MNDRELAATLAEITKKLAEVAVQVAKREPAPPPPSEDSERLLTPAEVSEYLRLEGKQVYGLAKRTDWQPYVVRAGRILRFRSSLLHAFRGGGGPI